jgi:hypothetical protein
MTPLIEIGDGVDDITGLVGVHVASRFLCIAKKAAFRLTPTPASSRFCIVSHWKLQARLLM